jgi:hypothetical protein
LDTDHLLVAADDASDRWTYATRGGGAAVLKKRKDDFARESMRISN